MERTSNESLIHIRGKDMYVEIHGSEKNPPLLYLHGGPGESCYDFCYHQAKRLQEDIRLIAVDQRGVCRSEAIDKRESFSLTDIVMDCEELRKKLGIKKWALLGHSFGGYLCLLYANIFPESISRIIFECPTFDFGLTTRNLLKKASNLFREEDRENLAKKCLMLSKSSKTTKNLMLEFMGIRPDLGERGMEIHVHNFDNPTDYSSYTDDEWEQFFNNTKIHNERLLEGDEMFDSILPRLKEVTHPSILINGQYDPVTCDEQAKTFLTDVEQGEIITLKNSGHFPHFEEPEGFKKIVVDFLQ